MSVSKKSWSMIMFCRLAGNVDTTQQLVNSKSAFLHKSVELATKIDSLPFGSTFIHEHLSASEQLKCVSDDSSAQ